MLDKSREGILTGPNRKLGKTPEAIVGGKHSGLFVEHHIAPDSAVILALYAYARTGVIPRTEK